MAEIVGLVASMPGLLELGIKSSKLRLFLTLATPSNVLRESGDITALAMAMAAWSDVSKSLAVAEMLLRAVADVELAKSFSATLLIVAASNDNFAAIEMPVSAGEDLEVRMHSGFTPMMRGKAKRSCCTSDVIQTWRQHLRV
ncbi:unnamed protein product [Fusarium graminearum]|uniref:Chromosome 3, complete genome n=1 Tax=Gibberella zeae (strain ATCC MYA-4620 / CBS 123657 / FGSC 9075 / NRRL 31084 / PH-1) TaxID=229533 RepID=A0A098DX16_GIBZE|nr:unnamed protein product [Fusarium graminearum]